MPFTNTFILFLVYHWRIIANGRTIKLQKSKWIRNAWVNIEVQQNCWINNMMAGVESFLPKVTWKWWCNNCIVLDRDDPLLQSHGANYLRWSESEPNYLVSLEHTSIIQGFFTLAFDDFEFLTSVTDNREHSVWLWKRKKTFDCFFISKFLSHGEAWMKRMLKLQNLLPLLVARSSSRIGTSG